MKTAIFIAISTLLSQVALAGVPFDDLSASYDKGQLPAVADLTAWYSGRCYFASSKDQAVASVLVGQQDDKDFKLIVIGHGNVSEDYYDQLTPASQAETTEYVTSNIPSITAAKEVEGSLASTFTTGSMEYRIRKATDGYVGRMVLTADAGDYKKGDTFAMCTYLKKVH